MKKGNMELAESKKIVPQIILYLLNFLLKHRTNTSTQKPVVIQDR